MACSRTRAWTAGSRTTPPAPTSSGAASNWGFTRVRNLPRSPSSSMTAGRITPMPVNETSQTARSKAPENPCAGTSTMLVRSSSVTRGSRRRLQANCARPTSTATTRAAPRWRRQSVNPPVEHPISMHVRPVGSTPNASSAPASLSPPRPTYGILPFTWIGAPGSMRAAGDSSRSPPHETSPAMHRRRASSRSAARPWAMSSSSTRTRRMATRSPRPVPTRLRAPAPLRRPRQRRPRPSGWRARPPRAG